jgi:hypothetical protein
MCSVETISRILLACKPWRDCDEDADDAIGLMHNERSLEIECGPQHVDDSVSYGIKYSCFLSGRHYSLPRLPGATTPIRRSRIWITAGVTHPC